MNSIFPKINEIRYIAARNNAAVIGVSESKLDETSLQSKIQISNYESLRFDRKRNGGGVACYIRSDNGYLEKHFFPKEIEIFFVEILLPEIKPLIVGITYALPNKSNFLEIINANFDKLDKDLKKSNILGNLYRNNKYFVFTRHKYTISSKFLSTGIKTFHQFRTIHGLK